VIAPSGAFDAEEFERGLAWLRGLGLQPVFSADVHERAAYLAGSDARRGRELGAAIADPDAVGVWCARGGYGSARLLPAHPPRALTARPKWLFGFSDATALHALWRRAGVASLYAANVTTLSKWEAAGRECLREWLASGAMAPLKGITVYGSRVVHGAVAGGNLSVLASLAGTGYLPSFRGALLFIEDVNEQPYRLDRCLTQLLQAGAFDGVRGLLIGQLTACGRADPEENSEIALKTLCRLLEPLELPLLAGLPVGHEMNAMPLPFGIPAVLDPATGQLRVEALAPATARAGQPTDDSRSPAEMVADHELRSRSGAD